MYGHPEFAMHVKGQELPAYDPRGVQDTVFSTLPVTVVDATSEVT